MDLASLTLVIVELAQAAGAEIMQIYHSADFTVDRKQDNSPLTAADLVSHQTIVAALQELTPQYPILSEESATLDFAERSQWTTYWLVDPLDGTKEFIKRNGEFSVLIALIHQHEPVLGVVHAPALQKTWYASLGNGAYLQVAQAEPELLSTREPSELVTIVGSRSHAGDFLPAFLQQFENYELISMGSILKACLVAEGKADFYPRLGLTSEWDTAAAQIIVEEAGGAMQDLNGQALKYNSKDSLLNPHFIVSGSQHYFDKTLDN
ncbi:3'(2'), 5'-bisphosphate nucleotidase [Thiothrix eikelboomii]|uniref:3'(2'),5'-bisphosphate nucleotidase CysQ n=1 Tax=Thiothrix eikelboomii TaxID=92487 RepID=A0A1T4X635_9GAMM|nr:3'(2'),5'-bisphosphate nucleotidase CysQ [Thiothrix eikelboomii]SKA85093.1 3'(2'), 5'-bisphosphate nucleotidase [Thiothrix eikelboomii]